MIDLEKTREQEFRTYVEGKTTGFQTGNAFNAGFNTGVAAVVSQLKEDKRRAYDAMYSARQRAAKCSEPSAALEETRRACEFAARVDYLQALVRQLTGE